MLGPKTLFVFMSLAYARDEVLWIVRHAGNLLKKANPEDFIDRYLYYSLNVTPDPKYHDGSNVKLNNVNSFDNSHFSRRVTVFAIQVD